MRSIVLKSGLVAAASVLASIGMAAMVLGVQSLSLDGNALLMCIFCPLLIAWPASAWNFLQKRRIADAHAELALAHADLAQAHARLAERARRDRMTGMLNRESFLDELASGCAMGVAGALLIIDADHFKAINDTHGHLTGDGALVEVAGAIARAAPAGCVIGRIGGEEFAAYLAASDLKAAAGAAEAIRREVAAIRFSPAGGAILPLTVSIGVAAFAGEPSVPQILRLADKRLYAAKRAGRNQIVAGEQPGLRAA